MYNFAGHTRFSHTFAYNWADTAAHPFSKARSTRLKKRTAQIHELLQIKRLTAAAGVDARTL